HGRYDLRFCVCAPAHPLSPFVRPIIGRPMCGLLGAGQLFTQEFEAILSASGVKGVPLPPRSPNLNAQAERFVRTIKESCLKRMILRGNWVASTNSRVCGAERNHQGLDNANQRTKRPRRMLV